MQTVAQKGNKTRYDLIATYANPVCTGFAFGFPAAHLIFRQGDTGTFKPALMRYSRGIPPHMHAAKDC